jgi:hypothetical protein
MFELIQNQWLAALVIAAWALHSAARSGLDLADYIIARGGLLRWLGKTLWNKEGK